MNDKTMTSALGKPIGDDNNSLTVSPSGPVLLQDVEMINKVAHFDRERIPERVVHAKGTGAFGEFVSYGNVKEYTKASFLQEKGKVTPVFVRFSTVIGSKGSSDTARDPRGFAVKLYTDQGNYDIVGNNMPVFFIRDAIKFPDLIHSLKPSPRSNIPDPERFWDFISLTPESTHMVTWVYSDRGTIDDYTKMDGFSVNTFIWVNEEGKRRFVKFHWKTKQGIKTIDRKEATRLSGENPDIAVENLRKDIENKNFPKWELCVQIMEIEDADKLEFDPLDATKTWPEDRFPLYPIGMMTLNKNPDNFFAQVEQSAFCPGNIIPGVEISADKMLVPRTFSYSDTQRYRLGANFSTLPTNRPLVKVHNNEQDGEATIFYSTSNTNYFPNSLNKNIPTPDSSVIPPKYCVSGEVEKTPIRKQDNFTQAGERFIQMTKEEKEHLADNIAIELYKCKNDIVNRVLKNFDQANHLFAQMVYDLIVKYRRENK